MDLLKIIIFTRFRRVVENAKWKGAEILVRALRGIPFLWMIILGFYGAILIIDFEYFFGIDASDLFITVLFIS